MKIGIYSPYLNTLTGGELYMFSIAESLSKNNEVTVFWDDRDILKKASERFGLSLKKISLKEDIFRRNSAIILLLTFELLKRFFLKSVLENAQAFFWVKAAEHFRQKDK